MTYWQEEKIKRTKELWQPEFDKIGVNLSDYDAIEIMETLTRFLKILGRWDRKDKQKEITSEVKKSPSKTEKDRLATIQELSKILNVPVSWIYQRTRQGKEAIPHMRFGKYLRFSPKEVVEFFKNS